MCLGDRIATPYTARRRSLAAHKCILAVRAEHLAAQLLRWGEGPERRGEDGEKEDGEKDDHCPKGEVEKAR